MSEQAFTFAIGGDEAVGILHPAAGRLGVLVIVGGPQYRVGSHRQFVLLARALAAGGIPVLRFDYRGLGDSAGAQRDFTDIETDIRTAIDCFVQRAGLTRVVLWGLCDAASAALMYAATDGRVAGLVLLNPWVHTTTGEARVRLKSYYLERLRSGAFWRKLVRFELDWRDSLASLRGYLGRAFVPARGGPVQSSYIDRMRCGWSAYGGPVLLILSGDDLTASEFRQMCDDDPAWRSLRDRATVQRVDLAQANHTFARAEWRATVEQETLTWVRHLANDDAMAV
jgi:exosortase A-associated hydrolase 1